MNMNYSKQLGIAICLILCAGVIHQGNARAFVGDQLSFQAEAAAEWQRYTVSGEEFSVSLPFAPAMNTSDIYFDKNRRRRERVIGAYDNGVVYVVYTFEKKSLTLDDLIKRFVHPGEQTDPVKVNDIAGSGSRWEDENRIGAVQLFATDQNFYVFQATGSKLGAPAAEIQKFFSSIKLGRQLEGNRMSDGAGEQPVANTETTLISLAIFSGKDVTRKASVTTKPEPRYTETARQHGITGTVVLRAVFSSSGVVTNIHTVANLPDGLTDRAIEAAHQIRFIPAIKDGRFVSMWMELQYNFNLY
jgi:TonB family protein